MFDIVNGFQSGSNQWLNIFLMTAAMVRVYLEIIQFDFSALPITKGMFRGDKEHARRFHRHGFLLSLGYIVLSAPFVLFA